MKIKKTFISAVLAVAMAAACFTGCKSENEADKYVVGGTPDYSSATGVIELDSWRIPGCTEEAFKTYAECGYNMVHLVNENVFTENTAASTVKLNETLDKYFTLAEKYGIKVIMCTAAHSLQQSTATPFQYVYERHKDVLEKWRDSDTFYGYDSFDEPPFVGGLNGGDSADAKKYQISYEEMGDYFRDDYVYFSNLFPNKKFEVVLLRAPNEGDKMSFSSRFDTYEKYLEYYAENVLSYMPLKDRVMMMDAYPYGIKNNGLWLRECFISSLEAMSFVAEKYGAEKWTCTQNHELITNTASVLYQYYTALAYGYTHFNTYTYGATPVSWGYDQSSIGIDGKKTDNYYYYQAAHEEIKSFENVYREFTDGWQGVIAVDGQESTAFSKPWFKAEKMLGGYYRIKSVSATEDTIIGVMRDKSGYDGFMIVNQTLPSGNVKDKVSITFERAKKAIVYKDGKPAQTVDLENGKLELTLKTGGGAFVIPLVGD